MKSLTVLITAVCMLGLSPAQAAPKDYRPIDVAAIPAYGPQGHVPQPYPMGRRHIAPSNGWSMAEGVVGHPPGCPRRAFCGCGTSVKVFGRPVRELFLARNWLKFPRVSPAAGMVAARYGHVFYIQSVNGDGTVLAYDPNSGGHQTRVHTVSLRGYKTVNPYGGRYASNSAITH
jgi:hypothetical protein